MGRSGLRKEIKMRKYMMVAVAFFAFNGVGCEEEALDSYLNWALEGTWDDPDAKASMEEELADAIRELLEAEYAASDYASVVKEVTVSVNLGDHPPVISITDYNEPVGCSELEYTNFSWKVNWGTGDVSCNARIEVVVDLFVGKEESTWKNFELTSAGTAQVVRSTDDQFEGSNYEIDFTKVVYTTSGDGTTTTEVNKEDGFGHLFMEVMIAPILKEYYGF